KGEGPIFDKYDIEEQINAIYRDRVELKSGGSLVIEPTEAVITIDVNSGRSHKRDAEETSFRTNLEAAEEIAKQLRLRDLGGLIVIDFIDMMDRKHISEVERTFKEALKNDRSRIQLARISKFGILELSRQKKQSTIQEISYTTCSHCRGSGWTPSIEYLALNTFRKIKKEAVRRDASEIEITLPPEVASYLLNNKRGEISKLEQNYDVSIWILGSTDMRLTEAGFNIVKKVAPPVDDNAEIKGDAAYKASVGAAAEEDEKTSKPAEEKHTRRRRPRRRRPKTSPSYSGDAEITGRREEDYITVIPGEEVIPKTDEDSEEKKEGIVRRFYNLLKL
ncbi:MAG: ribonuclease E/G, partial [Syntrophales bacterium]|nr:ribonuclease E/G [Syntrophales bacterium]